MACILVTGGAGFIGSNLVDKLILENNQVVIIDDLSTGFAKNINSKAIFIQKSINDDLSEIFGKYKFDYVFHLAAQMDVRKSTIDPIFDANTNILGSLNLIQACQKNQIKKIIYISTGGAVYGEPKYLPADELHPVNPLCPYGISKHAVEHYLYYYFYEYGLNYTVLRLPNVYGIRQNPFGEAGVVSIFINALLANKVPTLYGFGKATRDYVFVKDVVSACLLAIEKGDQEIINLGLGIEVSVQEILDEICKAMAIDIKPNYQDLRPGEIERISLSPKKAKDLLAWQAETNLEMGIKETVAWLKNDSKQ